MKPHPRIRKTIKWTAAAVTVLLVVVWIGSGWWTWQWYSPGYHWSLYLGNGEFHAARISILGGLPAPGLMENYIFDVGERWRWNVEAGQWWFRTGLWLPFAACFGGTLAAWRLDTLARRRAKLNLCPKCNYDRTGILQHAKCPECGAVPASV